MHRQKTKAIAAILTALIIGLVLLIVGTALLNKEQPTDKTDGPSDTGETYLTPAPVPPADYVQYLNKEITAAGNHLTAQIMMANTVAKGAYPADSALGSAQESLRAIQNCKENVTVVHPPESYQATRLEVLRCLSNAESTLQAYVAALESGSDTGQYAELLNGDATMLLSQANATYLK